MPKRRTPSDGRRARVFRQAVGRRLAAGAWELGRQLQATAARLLARASG